jgi:hypothetical protein
MHKIYSPVEHIAREQREGVILEARGMHCTKWSDSMTDTPQWCELHRGPCRDVVPVRRTFDDPTRQSEMFFACQKCIRDLKKAELIQDSKYAGHECYEIVVPRGLSKGRGLVLEFPVRQQRTEPQQRSFEVTLDALQVKYLRALGLRVIKT